MWVGKVTKLGDPQKSIKVAARPPPWESIKILVMALVKERKAGLKRLKI
jgi:hypothetical protein